MTLGGYEVELVTDFGQLGAGMQVIESPCKYCRAVHRHWLGKPGAGETFDKRGVSLGETRYFNLLHTDDCGLAFEPVVSERMVNRRVIYRVVDPKLTADSLASDARRVEALADLATRVRGERVR